MSVFCRHNRFTAECPICAKGTVLDPGRPSPRRPSAPKPRPRPGGGRPAPPAGARTTVGPHSSAGPYETEEGGTYTVRLERVPGGLRLGAWSGGVIERHAPELAAADLRALVAAACEEDVAQGRDADALRGALATKGEGLEAAPGAFAASAGRSGEMRDELRVEAMGEGRVRIARWLYRPGDREWELRDAAPMLPAARYAEAVAAAVRAGIVPAG